MTSRTIRKAKSKNGKQAADLLKLVDNPVGMEWAVFKVGWKKDSNDTVCTWEGIECDPFGDNIIKIDLKDAGFDGTIPTEFGNFPELQELILADNNYHGTIPSSILALPMLEKLSLSGNGLQDVFPYFSSSKMKNLDISRNRFEGSIPSNIGDLLPSLRVLDVSRNGITGTIPLSFAFIESLDYFDLAENLLEGTIPPNLGNLKNLQGLFLNGNKLIGTIPPSLTRSDSKLVQVFLEGNKLSGTVPVSFSDLKYLQNLYIDENKFTGTIPEELCNLNLNHDFFEGTEFDTPDRDGCESIACPVNTMSKEGVLPCYPCGVQVINPFLGKAGRCFHQNERIILTSFFEETGGLEWESSTGWGITDAPQCQFEGVSCNSAGHVTNITLIGNGLKGTIPEELGLLRHLRVLNLKDNEMVGNLPTSLKFPPLEELDISGNMLTGYVPPMLCLTGDVNGNGANGDYRCEVIACGAGYYSPTGFATYLEDGTIESCKPCDKHYLSSYIGAKSCMKGPAKINTPTFISTNTNVPYHKSSGTEIFVTMLMFSLVVLGAYLKRNNFEIPRPNLDDVHFPPLNLRSRFDRRDGEDDDNDDNNNGISSENPIVTRFRAIPKPNFQQIPKPNLNKLKVAQAKVMDRLKIPQVHMGNSRHSDLGAGQSVVTSEAVTDGMEYRQPNVHVSFEDKVVGDDISIESNMSLFTYIGDGADDDDLSMVCRSGLRQKKNEDEAAVTVMNRKVVEDRPPVPRTEPDVDEVSAFGSVVSESSSDESDETDDDNSKDEDETSPDVSHHTDDLSLLPLAQEGSNESASGGKDAKSQAKEELWLDVPDIS